jgi:hypothetical protein
MILCSNPGCQTTAGCQCNAGLAGAREMSSARMKSAASIKIPSDRGERLRIVMDDVDLRATIAALQSEIARMRDALEMAVGMLAPFEPGDSRAVSNEFVALASIVCGNDNEECWRIVNEWNERERASVAALSDPDVTRRGE